jgi:PKD repeat protein
VAKAVLVEPPNEPPAAAFTSSCSDLGCTFTDASQDPDGRIVAVNWSFGDGTSAEGSDTAHAYGAPGTYLVSLTAVDDDGATSTTTTAIDVRRVLHGAFVTGSTTRWYSRTNPSIHYWSADVVVGAHGADERPIAGATVTARWTGAVVKTATCVTAADGLCKFKSGTLSMLRSWVSLSIAAVQAPLGDFDGAATHNQLEGGTTSTVTFIKP